jgi:putative endonuclease
MRTKDDDTTTARGREAEAQAARHLEGHGLRVVARNFRVRGGEIDLICRDGKGLVFVEVRQRAASGFGGAAASIGAAKRAKLVAAAQAYLQNLPSMPPCRFDAVCFESGRLVWLKNCIETN